MKKNRILPLFAFLLFSISSIFSQSIDEPVVWKASIEKTTDSTYNVIFKAKILKNWYIFSQYNPENASLPMVISLPEPQKGVSLIGKAKEETPIKKYSDIWELEELIFKNETTLIQEVKVTNKNLTSITLNLFGQVCETACLQFEDNYTLNLNGKNQQDTTFFLDAKSKALSNKLKLDLKNTHYLNKNSTAEQNNTLSGIFGLGFLGGLLALLTPCVFPMIPLTVSFFTKQSQTKKKGIFNAILYGLFIVLIYMLLSVPFHLIDGLDPNILNTISTNIWLNIFFFIVLVFFAFSFFGFYEITLPNSWSNKMDSASDVGGIIGVFFMALTLAIISFSCTGPILGSLLAGSLSAVGNPAAQLSAGMAGFGVALALPFALFALFPNLLKSLPKSGGWLNNTKVVLGFLELAFAFKFLSNSDLVGHWGIFKREIFIGIWVLIFAGLAIYLFGKLKFPHDGPLKKLSFVRISFGVLVTAFVIYLIPGTFKTPTWQLSALSGFPPPQFYSVYPQESDCPLGLNCYKDFEEGLAVAKQTNTPILLDFTGWNCVNCREMEENVWSDPEIYNILKTNYVLISLYVDDYKKELPEAEQFKFKKANGKLKTIDSYGDKWSTFQIINFKTASQPYYVLLSPELDILNTPQQFTGIKTYKAWLEKGLVNYKK